jgi:hypothetical protein
VGSHPQKLPVGAAGVRLHGAAKRAHIFLCVIGYRLEGHLRQWLVQADTGCSARAALEAMEPMRMVTFHLLGVPAPLRVCIRPTPGAVVSALGNSPDSCSLLPPDRPPPAELAVVTRTLKFELNSVAQLENQAQLGRRPRKESTRPHSSSADSGSYSGSPGSVKRCPLPG